MHPGGQGLCTDYEGVMLDDEFYQYRFKVERCMAHAGHIWRNCPFVHAGEPVQRRHPSRHLPDICPLIKQGRMCPDGPERCRYAHNSFEAWLHPERFKTMLCRKGANCNRSICFFAHSAAELRTPTKAKPPHIAVSPGVLPVSLAVPDARCLVTPEMPAVTPDASVGVTSCNLLAAFSEQLYRQPQVSPGVPDLQVSPGVPDLQVSLAIPDLQVSPGVPDLQVSLAIPDLQVSPWVPDLQVSLAVPGLQDSLAHFAPPVSLGVTPELQQLAHVSLGGPEHNFSFSTLSKEEVHGVTGGPSSSSPSSSSASADTVRASSADSSFCTASGRGYLTGSSSSSGSRVHGFVTPWSSPVAAAAAAETAAAGAALQYNPFNQAVQSMPVLHSLEQRRQQQQAVQLLQQQSNTLAVLLGQQQQFEQQLQKQLHALQLQEHIGILQAMQRPHAGLLKQQPNFKP